MIDDAKLELALDWLRDNANAAAKARAERVYLEEWLPALRAQIAAQCIAAGDSAAAADTKAKASDAYRDALAGYKIAVEADERMRWHRTRADAIVSAWQTMSANARALGRAT